MTYKNMKKTGLFLISLVALLVVGAAQAKTVATAPDALISRLTAEWQAEVNKQTAAIDKDKAVLFRITDRITAPYIDYQKIARLVLGKYWRKASDPQKKEFIQAFRDDLVRKYATVLYSYREAEISVKPVNYKETDKNVRVKTVASLAGRKPVSVNFILYKKDENWRAMDVLTEGVSVVATLRGIYRSEIQKKGLDKVIADLASKSKS